MTPARILPLLGVAAMIPSSLFSVVENRDNGSVEFSRRASFGRVVLLDLYGDVG